MGGKGGGQANSSGVYAALAAAQAGDQAYTLGTQQLQWAQQVWGQEQPMIQQVVSSDVAAQQQQADFARQQEALYTGTYQPLEQTYAQQARDWASPAQQTINAGAAQANVNEAAESQRSAAQTQLESYGINPGSTRYAGLDIGARTMEAAASAGAGTQAIQATKLQGLGLEAGVVNTGRGLPNTVAGLASTGVGAGSAAAGGLQSNLATGSGAQTAPSNWFNTGASNINAYTNAVNGFNQSQLGYAQVGAMQSMGMGSLAGGVMGMLEKGGEIIPKYQEGGQVIPHPTGGGGATPTPGVIPNSPMNIPQGETPGGFVPAHTSPSQGKESDDVPARLTVGEFVIPKDVTQWEGQKSMYSLIDKARKAKQAATQRQDVGGERGYATPATPTFTSLPMRHQVIPSQPRAV